MLRARNVWYDGCGRGIREQPGAAATTAVYTATKGAVDTVTHVLELGSKKIRVNSINAGMVQTEGVHTSGIIGSDFQKQLEAQTPLGGIAQPNDIARLPCSWHREIQDG